MRNPEIRVRMITRVAPNRVAPARSFALRAGRWSRKIGRRMVGWVAAGVRIFGGVAVLWLGFLPQALWANPGGERVVGGAASFQRPDAATLVVHQQSDRAVINWNNFSIAKGEVTRFVQPSASSAALNRVVTAHPSQIYGSLQANGQIYLINPGGVMVGPGGVVDVAGFVASTRDIGNEEFMRGGDLVFRGNSEAAILNQGDVTARNGDVFLVAREVKNEGQLMARDGTVGMVSGTEVSLQAVGKGNYKIRLLAAENEPTTAGGERREAEGEAEIVNEGVIQAANAVLEATGSYLPMAIKNTGLIQATGAVRNADGTVSLIGGEGDVLNTGVVAALRRSLDGQTETGGSVLMAGKNVTSDPGSILTAAGRDGGGEIKLRAADTTMLRGSIEVVGVSESAKGGQVQLLGEKVGMFESAKVDASGGAGGGEVLVGGDYLGKNPEVPNAKAVVMAPTAEIRADATTSGDGGKVILWSDEYTGFFGEITTQGGVDGGHGGFVETSSADNLQAFGQVDASASAGRAGRWLLDPRNVEVVAAAMSTELARGSFSGANPSVFIPTVNDAKILNSQIDSALNRGISVTITTGTTGTQAGNITVSAPITRSQPAATQAGQVTLTLQAANDIVIGAAIESTSGSLGLAFYADADGRGGGTFRLGANLTTLGGDVLISAAGIARTAGTITTTTALNGGTAQTIAGDVTIRPSTANVDIGINGGAGTFLVTQDFLNALDVTGAALPGTVTIGSRSAGNLTLGAATVFNGADENLTLLTGGNLRGALAANSITMGTGLLTLSAAGNITDTGGGQFRFTGTRVAAILEGNELRLRSLATLAQLGVTTDGTVAIQQITDAVPAGLPFVTAATSNLNWTVTELNNDTEIFGISLVSGSLDLKYQNTRGDISVFGGGVSSVLINNRNLPLAPGATVTFDPPDPGTGGIPATAIIDNLTGFVTITNPGSGYTTAPSLTLTGGALVPPAVNGVGFGTLNVQSANNGIPADFRDFVLSAPQGRIISTVPIFTGGGNLTLEATDLVLRGVFPGSLFVQDDIASVLPTTSYDNLGVINTFQATTFQIPYGNLALGNAAAPDITFIGGSFGIRGPLLPTRQILAPGQIAGTGGILSLEATTSSVEGRPVFIEVGDTPNSFSINILEQPLLEAPGIRIGGALAADVSITSILAVAGTIFTQEVTTRPDNGNSSDRRINYDPRYFENPYFNGTRRNAAPFNADDDASDPHVAGGTVSLVSGRGFVRNVQGGDVHVSALSLTAVDEIFFDSRSTGGTYAELGEVQANGSIFRGVSARSGRTVPEVDVSIGNGGDVTLNLNFWTTYINDGRLAVNGGSEFSQTQTATGTATAAGGVVTEINTAAGGSGMLYTSAPVVTLTGGGVQEASARAILNNGGVALVVPQIVGQGYTPSTLNRQGTLSGPTVTLSGGGTGASGAVIGNGGMAFVSDNRVISVFNVTNGGSGYDEKAPPQVILSGGGANGREPTRAAVARAVVENGVVTKLIVVDPGEGYTANPSGISITIQAPSAGGERAQAVVDADFRPALFGNSLTPIYVSKAGSGYTVEPTVTLAGGGIKQAQARAVVQLDPTSNRYGDLVGFEITERGLGYSGNPTVTIGSGQVFGNFGEYGVSTETVDRNVGSGNILISNLGNVAGNLILNAPLRTGDAAGVPGGDAVTGSILLNISGSITANDNNNINSFMPNPGGARGIIITGDASLIPEFGSTGNTRSGSVTIEALGIKNNTEGHSSLYQLSGSEGFPIQIGTASGGTANLTGSLNVGLAARVAGQVSTGNLQIYAPAPGQVQQALGNVPLDPNHPQGPPRASNDLVLAGLSTPQVITDAGGNQVEDESLVTVEVGAFEGKLTLARTSGSQATAIVTNGRVTLINPDQSGQLFAAAPTVVITGGGITPASATVFTKNGTLTAPDGGNSITPGNGLDNAGQGYFTVPTVTFSGGGGSGAQAVAVIDSAGRISSIQITNPGFGYTSLPTVLISAPAGVPATAAVTVQNQTLAQTSLTVANGGITNPGVGYTVPPLVTVTGGRLGTATATATVDTSPGSSTYSQITGITINLNGDTFPSGAATVTIAQPSGQATATATLANGKVTSFTITSPGGGYTSTPSVLLTTGTATTPYTLTGDRVGLFADRFQIFEPGTPSNVLFEAGMVALAPYTNQRPVNLGTSTPGSTSFLATDFQRFQAEDLVVGRRSASHLGVGAGEFTVSAPLASANLRVRNGIFLAGTRGLKDKGGATGISFPAVSANFGSRVEMTGTGNAMHYFTGIIQSPFEELTYRKPMILTSALQASATGVSLPLTVAELFGNPAYFTGQRFNQGITTQNGDVTISADLFEQTRLVGFIDTTGGGKYPVSSAPNNSVASLSDYATVTLAPNTAGRPISVYANSPGGGLALRVGNPQALGLEQIRAGTLRIGSSASGTITLNSDLGFNYLQYPDAPRSLILDAGKGSLVAGISQVPPSPNPVPRTSAIRVASLTVLSSAGNITLNGNNQVSLLSAPGVTGNLEFRNRSGAGLTLAGVDVGGNLTLNTDGAIDQIQTGSGVDVDGKTTLTSSGSINLGAGSINSFVGTVTATSVGNITLRNNRPLLLGRIRAQSGGDLTLQGVRGVTGSSQVLGRVTSIAAGAGVISLANSGNDFTGAVTLSNSGGFDITLVDKNALLIAGLSGSGPTLLTAGTALTLAAPTSFTGSLTATARTSILVSESLTQLSGTSSFLAGTSFTLDGNKQLQATGSGSILLQADSISLGSASSAVTANGGITLRPANNSKAIGIEDNTVAGALAISEAMLQQLASKGTVTIGSRSGTGVIDIGSLGSVNLSDERYSLNLANSSGGVDFNFAAPDSLTLPDGKTFDLSIGTSKVNGGAGTDVQFGVGGGGDGTISFSSAGTVSSFTGKASTLGASNLTGSLDYTHVSPFFNPDLEVLQIRVNGTARFTLPGGTSLAAASPQNAFHRTVTIRPASGTVDNVMIMNSRTLTLADLTLDGNFRSAVTGGSLVMGSTSVGGNFLASATGIQGGALRVPVGATLLAAGTGDLVLANSGNNFGTALTILSARNASLFVPVTDDLLLGRAGSVVRATQTFGLTTTTGAGITLLAPTDPGGFYLSRSQMRNFTVGTFAPTATAADLVVAGRFQFANIPNLSLNTRTSGNVDASGIGWGLDSGIHVDTLSVDAAGWADLNAVNAQGVAQNRILNLGTVRTRGLGSVGVKAGNFSFINGRDLNLTGTVSASGTADLTVAGQFYNYSGQARPFDGTEGRAKVVSLSMFGGMPDQISGLAGFSPGYFFQDPGGDRVMVFAVAPLTMFTPDGTRIAGIDLSGQDAGGGQLNTFFTGSDNLNWMIADFGKFNLPKVDPARMDYMLYPTRVEPETRSLPQPLMKELTTELGRPPTLGEIQQREISRREASRLRVGAILERNSFDEDPPEPQQEASSWIPGLDGGKPQAKVGGQVEEVSEGSGPIVETAKPQAKNEKEGKKDSNGSMLRSGPRRAVALLRPSAPQDSEVPDISGKASAQQILQEERERAAVGVAAPLAGGR